MKVLFAEQGDKAQALATIRAIREEAEQTRAQHAELAGDLATTGGPFPDRLHVNELVLKFMWEQAETVIRWSSWAEHQVVGWPDDLAPPGPAHTGDFLRNAAEID